MVSRPVALLSLSLAASTSFFVGNVAFAQGANNRTTSDTVSFLKQSLDTLSSQPSYPTSSNGITKKASPQGRPRTNLSSDAFSSRSTAHASPKYLPEVKLPTRAELAKRRMASNPTNTPTSMPSPAVSSEVLAQYPDLQKSNFSMPPQATLGLSAQSKEDLSRLTEQVCQQESMLRTVQANPVQFQAPNQASNQVSNLAQGQSPNTLYDRVGPPPFPLCLLPETYWKDVLHKTTARKPITSQIAPQGPSHVPGLLSNIQLKRGSIPMHTSSSSFISTAQMARVSGDEKGSLKKKAGARQMKHTSLSESYFTVAGSSSFGKAKAMTYPTYYSSVQFPN